MAGILISSFNHPSCFVISNEQTTNPIIESSHLPMRMMPATKYPSLKLRNKPLFTPCDCEPSSYSSGPTKKKNYKRNDPDEIRRLNKLEKERSKSTNFPIGRTTLYDQNQSILILRDGNLSFSRSLIERLGTGNNITTTVYDPLCKYIKVG